MKAYIANLRKYNEGKIAGEWFNLPVNYEKVAQAIGLNKECEEYIILDYELPIDEFEVGGYRSIDSLNKIAELAQSLTDEQLQVAQILIKNGIVDSLEDAVKKMEEGEYTIYYDCESMEDVAHAIVVETGLLSNVPEEVKTYFDYKAYARDLEISGSFYKGVIEGQTFYIEIHS